MKSVLKSMKKNIGKGEEKRNEAPPITQFSGYYEFLSIDHPCWVFHEGFLYPSLSIAFQAARTKDSTLRRKISEVKQHSELKALIVQIQNAPDWNEKRLKVMLALNRDKFKRNKDLGLKLFATQSRQLANCYPKGGDAELFWGMVQQPNGSYDGLNTLGKILEEIRLQMKNGTDSKHWVQVQNLQSDQDLWPEVNLIVQKEGDDVDNILLNNKNYFLLGNSQLNDFRLEHGSISKFHAAIYFSSNMQVLLVDLNTTHGTVILRGDQTIKLESLRPQSLQNKDIIKFGMSTRRYTVYLSYEQVEARISRKQKQAREELSRIQKLKKLEMENIDNHQKQREAIKSLLDLKQYCCLYVENINRNFSYKDIKETFNQYGPVKNVRINIDQKTGRFMGSVLVYYDEKTKINSVLQSIARNPLKYEFRIVAVNQDEAEKIITTFTNKEKQQEQQKKLEEEKAKQNEERRKREPRRESRSRSRERRKSRSDSSSSSSSSNSSSSSRPKRHKF